VIIAVGSGKGGTGKTTVATSLALSVVASEPGSAGLADTPNRLLFLDCDVEVPNAALFLHPVLDESETVAIPIPEVDLDVCTFCGRCAEVCVWHAITVVGHQILVFPELCHGCGSCTLNCPEAAIREIDNVIGTVESGRAGRILFGQGVLDVGQPMAVPLIRRLKERHLDGMADGLAVLDAPAGTSCPCVETLRGVDYVLLVTEPTPFGLHDLRLAVDVARDELALPVGVVVNRDGVGDAAVDDYCREEGIPVLLRIPLDRRIAEGLSEGHPLVQILPEYIPLFRTLLQRITIEVAR
jgi:MinD superfamily P-loop ATPase